MQEHCQKSAGSVFLSICLTEVLRFSFHIPTAADSKEPQTQVR